MNYIFNFIIGTSIQKFVVGKLFFFTSLLRKFFFFFLSFYEVSYAHNDKIV